ncbi:MAG TPA: hypothetical protein VE954_07730 [Oligoflexus sp.]|uniref:hypothetical protein n=1 Tax=Oligoflexus sp. TaxID=1971216 RepID=UPI002D2267F8|nr:hypothetical protein [Oligoflexus sp.]HYX32990.1 hypothetical protein [Oligoflexus sp.]
MKILSLSVMLFALLFQTSTLAAQEITVLKRGERDNPWVPNSAITQHAAYAGYLAAGFGYEWRDTWAVDLLYGYTPEEFAGEAVHSWTLKSLAYIGAVGSRDVVRVRPYVGLSINYSPDSELFLQVPSQYPAGYYPASAVRPALIGGLEVRVQSQLAIGFEFAVLDSELAYATDSKNFDPEYMGSSGLSVRWLL